MLVARNPTFSGEEVQVNVQKQREPAFSSDRYRVRVTYDPLPSIEGLEKKFSRGGVSPLFDDRAWEREVICASIDETEGDRIFRVAKPDEVFRLNPRLLFFYWRDGWRPAIEIEAVAFADAHPNIQRENRILAHGSFVIPVGSHCCHVTMLCMRGRNRVLETRWSSAQLLKGDRVLLVRKV